MNSSLKIRILPLAVVICSVIWLVTSVQVLMVNADTQNWRELLGSLMAVVGLNSYLTAVLDDFGGILKAVTVRITAAGDVTCMLYLKALWSKDTGACAATTRDRLAKLIRDGRLDLVHIHSEVWEARREARRAKGVNVDRGDAPGDHLLEKFRAGLTEFSACCNALKIPFVQNPKEAGARMERLLDDAEIAEVCLGLVRHIYHLHGEDSWEAAGHSSNGFSPWGIHADHKEWPVARFYLSNFSVNEMAERYEMEPRDLISHRLALHRYPESVIVRDFLPGLLCWSYLFKERIRSKGGILERIEDNYWPLIYWSIEIRAPLDMQCAPGAAAHLAEQIKNAIPEEVRRSQDINVPV